MHRPRGETYEYAPPALYSLSEPCHDYWAEKLHPVAWKARSPEIRLSFGNAAISCEIDFARIKLNWQKVHFLNNHAQTTAHAKSKIAPEFLQGQTTNRSAQDHNVFYVSV